MSSTLYDCNGKAVIRQTQTLDKTNRLNDEQLVFRETEIIKGRENQPATYSISFNIFPFK
jgi:hypothetical protein